MSPVLHIGCCGWSYLQERDFDALRGKRFASKLQAYASLFSSVEINSTFYRIPRLSTAEKWWRESAEVNQDFVFTVKAYQGITHKDRFGVSSRSLFGSVAEVASGVHAPVILFQCPASLRPTVEQIKKMRAFLDSIDRGKFLLAWEPRGSWYDNPQAIIDMCEEHCLVHCVDPFRNKPLSFGGSDIAYFRLHGFGTPSMYNYNFSASELEVLRSLLSTLPHSLRAVYVFFNNVACYANGVEFAQMITRSR